MGHLYAQTMGAVAIPFLAFALLVIAGGLLVVGQWNRRGIRFWAGAAMLFGGAAAFIVLLIAIGL